jgi:peptidoglycan hydrolase-like protein with peptidoglycan-binding domain
MTMPDAELTAALKQASSKKMFFAFILKGSDGQLLVSKAKIPPKAIAEAKKEVGGVPITGKCFGPINDLLFQVAKQPPPSLGAALKKVIKRDTGLTIVPNFLLARDADAVEPEEKGADAPAAAGAAPGQAGPLPPPIQANVAGIQKALLKLGYDPGKIDGVMSPRSQAALKKFQQANGLAADGIVGPKTQATLAKALRAAGAAGGTQATATGGSQAAPEVTRPVGAQASAGHEDAAKSPSAKALDLGPWQAARGMAVNDLKALAMKIAGTRHGIAAGVLREINSIIVKLPASPKPGDIDELEDFVRNDDGITAAEEVPGQFHDLVIREPLLKELETLRQ